MNPLHAPRPWHEFATNPSAVTFGDDDVRVEDWLIQPVAADVVAELVAGHALDPSASARVELAGRSKSDFRN
jgi:hypothetical protein